jgi:hypothetical protein
MTTAMEQRVKVGETELADLSLDREHELGSLSMDAHTDLRPANQDVVAPIVQPRNMECVQEGVEAYNRERDSLQAKHRYHSVAYVGGRRIAIAPTRRRLEKKLSEMKDLNRSNLFVTCVSPPDADDDLVMSR